MHTHLVQLSDEENEHFKEIKRLWVGANKEGDDLNIFVGCKPLGCLCHERRLADARIAGDEQALLAAVWLCHVVLDGLEVAVACDKAVAARARHELVLHGRQLQGRQLRLKLGVLRINGRVQHRIDLCVCVCVGEGRGEKK